MRARQSGQGIAEYAVIIGLLAVVVIGAIILLGGGVEGVFQDTTDALDSGEAQPTDTPEPTPTPDAFTAACTQKLALSKQSSVQFSCRMDANIDNIKEIESVTISISPAPPDFHVVMLKFPSQKETRFFCGPGGCRGFSGASSYLYPFSDTSDNLPDEWTSNSTLRRWLTGEISGNASYYRLKGDGTKPGAWKLTKPEEPWQGVLQITVYGKSGESDKGD